MPEQPTVGRIVHYVSYGTPGGEYTSQCRAAIVAGVPVGALPLADTEHAEEWDSEAVVLDLAVLNPTGLFFNRCAYDDGSGKPGDPACPDAASHGSPFRYCACGWTEPSLKGGTWHWPERV